MESSGPAVFFVKGTSCAGLLGGQGLPGGFVKRPVQGVAPANELFTIDQSGKIWKLSGQGRAFTSLPVAVNPIPLVSFAGGRVGFDFITLAEPGEGGFDRHR